MSESHSGHCGNCGRAIAQGVICPKCWSDAVNKKVVSENVQTWDDLKQQGSAHYKDGATEPIDLYRSGDMFRHFALCSIIKYAFRNRNINNPVKNKDMDKIIHYAELLKASCGEVGTEPSAK